MSDDSASGKTRPSVIPSTNDAAYRRLIDADGIDSSVSLCDVRDASEVLAIVTPPTPGARVSDSAGSAARRVIESTSDVSSLHSNGVTLHETEHTADKLEGWPVRGGGGESTELLARLDVPEDDGVLSVVLLIGPTTPRPWTAGQSTKSSS